MPTLYSARVVPTNITVTGGQTGYGAANLQSDALAKPWRSLDTTQQEVEFLFAVGKTIQAVSVSDVNFASAEVYVKVGTGAYGAKLGDLATYAGKESRRRGFYVVNTANVTGVKLRILNGASTDSLAYKRIGNMMAFSAAITVPPGPEWGYNPRWIIPRVFNTLSNGQRPRAATGSRYHLITAHVKQFGSEDWQPFFAALDVGVCLFTMNLPAPRQWQSWPVILDNDEIDGKVVNLYSDEFDITLREVV